MPEVTPRRLRLWGEPGQLTRVDENTLDEARRRLRGLRDDVELSDIDQRAADSIDIILLVPASFRSSESPDSWTKLSKARACPLSNLASWLSPSPLRRPRARSG